MCPIRNTNVMVFSNHTQTSNHHDINIGVLQSINKPINLSYFMSLPLLIQNDIAINNKQ